MKIKIFSDYVLSDIDTEKVTKVMAKKGKQFDTLEVRVNRFMENKHILDVKSQIITSLLSEPRMFVSVLYEH